ncbi:hypothetical protein VN97_g6127 [Penicillium thymicola]|uniref:Uncharacterized protein n=1 Tax=Penicillium thymicola TaxID=293382 RepID=A0AAI9TI86_PENTH|nr:hypothetical protein VN97_g6127 [Penicillium thymicola]
MIAPYETRYSMSKFNEYDFKCVQKLTSTVLEGESPPVNSSLYSGSLCILFYMHYVRFTYNIFQSAIA